MQFLNQDCSRGSSYCKGECEWNYKSDECQTRVEQHRYIAIRDPLANAVVEIRGPYSNLTLAENDLKEFGDKGGYSMILKTVDGVIQENENEIDLVNKEKKYGNDEELQSLIQNLKNKCK